MDKLNAEWRKSTKSGNPGACVKVRYVDGMIQVGDTKSDAAPVLSFNEDEWDAFVRGTKAGEFDL